MWQCCGLLCPGGQPCAHPDAEDIIEGTNSSQKYHLKYLCCHDLTLIFYQY